MFAEEVKKNQFKKKIFVGPRQIVIVIVDNNLRKAHKCLFHSYTHSQLILKASLNESIHLLKKKAVDIRRKIIQLCQNTTVKRCTLCSVPLRCLDVIGFKNEVKSLFVVELKL